jgi:GTP-binding protein HflX
LLLHVIDASDPFVDERIEVVHDVLKDIWANQDKILVFNKIDLLPQEKIDELKEHFKDSQAVFISVKEGKGFEELKTLLCEKLK